MKSGLRMKETELDNIYVLLSVKATLIEKNNNQVRT